MGSYVILYPERGLRLYVYTQCAPRYALLQVIPICRWHPPRRQQHRGPFRLRSSFPTEKKRERVEKKRPFKARRKTKRPRRCLLLLETLLCTIALRTRRDTFSSFCGVRVITILPGQLLCLRGRMVNRPKGERKMVEEREVLQNSETNSELGRKIVDEFDCWMYVLRLFKKWMDKIRCTV